ncbi:MAG: TonB-dependent receptor [Proteobacteria bacterium]|nr:TonB-dependent receptor [Pseudomonadota bacterium]
MSAKSQLLLSTALLSASLAVTGIQPGYAQDQDDESTIEEVLVTATRRGATDIQTTAVAVTAITSADIERLAPRDVGALAWSVPNFSNGQTAGFNSASYSIRGVGQTDIIVYLDSPVGVVIDDFVVPHIQSQNLEMFDIEQVEVLRGPQGTLFGKNTTAGVINVRTKRPVLGETSVDARLKYGSFGTKEIQTALNFGAGDTIAFRFAGMYLKSDGFYKNNASFGPVAPFAQFAPSQYAGLTGQGDGRSLGGDDLFSGRAKLLWQPNDNISVLLQYEMVRDNAASPPTFNGSPSDFVLPLMGFTREAGDPVKLVGLTANTAGSVIDPEGQGHQVDIDGFYGNVEWDFEGYTIHSVTGYRTQESRLANSYVGEVGPIPLFDATRDDKRRTFQQEIRITSDLDGPINFVAGVFYQSNDTDFCVTQALGFVDLLLGDIGLDFANRPQILCNAQDAVAYAGFVDGTYEVNEKLSISAGFRYTYEKKKWVGRHQLFLDELAPGGLDDLLDGADFIRFPTGVARDQKSWKEPTYRATASYEFNDDLFGYATFAHGFKSGGYNDQTGTDGNPFNSFPVDQQALFLAPTEPEFANSYELGMKGSTHDGSLRFAISLFYVKYKDAQRSSVVQITNQAGVDFQLTRFFNAAEMTIKGLEFESTWIPAPGWLIKGNLGIQRGRYNHFLVDGNFDGDFDDVGIDADLSDRRITKAPEFSFGFDFIYEHDVAGGTLEWYGNIAHEGNAIYNYGPTEASDGLLRAKTLLNANLTYRDADDRYFVRFVGKNLTDKRYESGNLTVGNLWVMISYGQPRFFGAEIGFKFGN